MIIIELDKKNKQYDYKYIAKDMDGNLVIGWIVVEQPWRTPKSYWTYWMYSNEYGSYRMHSGCTSRTNLGFKKVKVNPDTIKPLNQIELIKYCLEHGNTIRLEETFYKGLAYVNSYTIINSVDEIPYELWENE